MAPRTRTANWTSSTIRTLSIGNIFSCSSVFRQKIYFSLFSISNDGVKILARDSTDYGQIRSEFESLFQMNDPSFDESNYKQFVTMAM